MFRPGIAGRIAHWLAETVAPSDLIAAKPAQRRFLHE